MCTKWERQICRKWVNFVGSGKGFRTLRKYPRPSRPCDQARLLEVHIQSEQLHVFTIENNVESWKGLHTIYPKAEPSILRQAHLSRGGPIYPEAGTLRRYSKAESRMAPSETCPVVKRPSIYNIRQSRPYIRQSRPDIRQSSQSRPDIRRGERTLRSYSKAESPMAPSETCPVVKRPSINDIRQSRPYIRQSRLDIRQSKPDIRQSKPDIRQYRAAGFSVECFGLGRRGGTGRRWWGGGS